MKPALTNMKITKKPQNGICLPLNRVISVDKQVWQISIMMMENMKKPQNGIKKLQNKDILSRNTV